MPENVAAILVQIVPLVLIFVIFYFVLIPPQRKKDKEVKNMLANLKVGDRRRRLTRPSRPSRTTSSPSPSAPTAPRP